MKTKLIMAPAGSPEDLQRDMLLLIDFRAAFSHFVEPKGFQSNWHIEAICEHLAGPPLAPAFLPRLAFFIGAVSSISPVAIRITWTASALPIRRQDVFRLGVSGYLFVFRRKMAFIYAFGSFP
jgi:hypothetical protein